MAKVRLGDLLVDARIINREQLARALSNQSRRGMRLGATLVDMGLLTEEVLRKALSRQMRLPSVDFKKVGEIKPTTLEIVDLDEAEKYQIIPLTLSIDKGRTILHLAMSDPTNVEAISDVEFRTGHKVQVYIATDTEISKAIGKYYRGVQQMDELGVSGGGNTNENQEDGFYNGAAESESIGFTYDDKPKQPAPPNDEQIVAALSKEMRALLSLLTRKGVIDPHEYLRELKKMK